MTLTLNLPVNINQIRSKRTVIPGLLSWSQSQAETGWRREDWLLGSNGSDLTGMTGRQESVLVEEIQHLRPTTTKSFPFDLETFSPQILLTSFKRFGN